MADVDKATDSSGVMETLLAREYRDKRVYVRRVENVFFWDVLFNNELYTSSIKVTEGGETLSDDARKEAIDLCYAGACRTIDLLMSGKTN